MGQQVFWGMHLLYNLLESNSKDYVYCVVREKNVESAKERLLEIFHFYFNDDYEEVVNSRVKIVLGDLCEDNFGMSDEDYFNLGSMTSKVIHCCAIVKHFGRKEEFHKANVQGTSKVAEFCQRFDAYMLFVSSIAVIEKMTTDGNWKYRADNLSDEYVKIEFLPVDECAKALNYILADEKEGIYLFYNYNTVTYKKIVKYFTELGFAIQIKEYQDFVSCLREVSKFGLDREALAGFYLSARRKHKREYYYEPTMDYLRGIHFDWPVISKGYIKKIVKYMKKINFLEVRMKNYVNYNPCKVYFGRSVIQYLPDEICKLGSRVLLVFGVNSIKENGIYEQVIELLEEKHINYCEYSGVKANPTIELVEKGIEICRTYGAEVILAVGGGSVIDCSKAIRINKS